ncbi:hypothetical protein [Labedaea rhizosphaerae]|uniref:hypothetical protein n=1 Tax=Labedaea rhizosphaerae TaxID=598644 RepID=UPI0010618FE7|nr:hypothetical protein [Labedaea rhizosphaerae]
MTRHEMSSKGADVVKPVDAFLRDCVRVLLKEVGFSKRGRDFRLVATNGDLAAINFLSWRLGEREAEFYVDAGVSPLPWIEWREHVDAVQDETSASALWWTRLRSPHNHLGLWQFNLDESERIEELVTKLTSLAEKLRSLTDRRLLLNLVRDPATRIQELRRSRAESVALLLVDEGPSPELAEALRAMEAEEDSDRRMVAWIRAKLSRY